MIATGWEFHSANMSVCEEPSLAALLREWCPHSLSEETAPLLSELAASATANLPDTDPARDDWVALQEECANAESSLAEDGNGSAPAPPAPPASYAAESMASRKADAALGIGPVTMHLHPPGERAPARSRSQPSLKQPLPRSTFGSSRESLSSISSWEEDTASAKRFQKPGPGAYRPAQPSRSRLAGRSACFPTGASWGKEDRQKHLGLSVRPRGQYHALPKYQGPAPGYYPNPQFNSPKERAPRYATSAARIFRPGSELPAGSPPHRNAQAVSAARALNTTQVPAPGAYDPPRPTTERLAGRFAAHPRAKSAASASASASASAARAAPAGREDAASVPREEVERVRERHELLASGSRRTMRAPPAPPPPPIKLPKGGSTWSRNSGREMDADVVVKGVEPAHKRGPGPAAYDPRRGTEIVKPSTRVGGHVGVGARFDRR